jgi:hypothetical protein
LTELGKRGARACERVATSLEGSGHALVADGLAPSPSLRLAHEPAELAEQLAGGGTGALEALDPIEPLQHGARLFHAIEASSEPRTELQRL